MMRRVIELRAMSWLVHHSMMGQAGKDRLQQGHRGHAIIAFMRWPCLMISLGTLGILMPEDYGLQSSS